MEQLRARKISTPDGPLTDADFEPIHEDEVTALIKEFGAKNESSVFKFKGVIQKQISNKILGSYMKRDEERKVL